MSIGSLLKKQDGSHNLHIGCDGDEERDTLIRIFVDDIINQDGKFAVYNLSRDELVRTLTELFHSIDYPLVEEVIPMSRLHEQKVEFRIVHFNDPNDGIWEADYCKVSHNWTTGNVATGGTTQASSDVIEALVQEHVTNPPEGLAAAIHKDLVSVALRYRDAYYEFLSQMIRPLPEGLNPYEIRSDSNPSVIDIGIQILPDGDYKFFLIEAALGGRLSGLEDPNPGFVSKFYDLHDTMDLCYRPPQLFDT